MKICAILGIGLALALPGAASADLNISKNATLNVNCSAGVCTATAKNAVLNVGDLTAMLASGDATVRTGGGAVAIQVNDGFSWTNTNRLTLDANESVGVHKPVVVAGTGALTITTNDGGTGGDLKFFPGGKIDFWDTNSSLVINGNSHTLLSDLVTMINDIAANPAGYYALASDIDQPLKLGHAPVKYLSGTFEGLGNAISNLTLKTGREDVSIGLFGNSSGFIRDLYLTQMKVAGAYGGTVGALVGINSGTLAGDTVDAVVTGNAAQAVGGMVGENRGIVERCSSGGNVTAPPWQGYDASYVGGLVGYSSSASGQIEDSSSSASVSGTAAVVGGLVGAASGYVIDSHATGLSGDSSTGIAGGLIGSNGAVLSNSYATGNVTSLYGQAGGLVASNGGTISNSFARGSVYGMWNQENGGSLAGGLVGGNTGTISNSYAIGDAKTDRGYVGGFAGANEGTMTSSYSLGMPSAVQASDVGGYVGGDYGSVTFGYWDMDTSGISNPAQGAGNRKHDPGVRGRTDSELKSALPKGFDPKIWGQDPNINSGYPYLLTNPPQ